MVPRWSALNKTARAAAVDGRRQHHGRGAAASDRSSRLPTVVAPSSESHSTSGRPSRPPSRRSGRPCRKRRERHVRKSASAAQGLPARCPGLLPVDPGDLVVLRIGIVVALLGAAELVALLDQRAGRARNSVASSARTSRRRASMIVGVRRSAFDAAVPGRVVVVPVAVAPRHSPRCACLVGDEIGEREAVMHGEEVDRRVLGCRRRRRSRPSRQCRPARRSCRHRHARTADLVAIGVVPLAEFLAGNGRAGSRPARGPTARRRGRVAQHRIVA